ncbi:KH domain-containing protein [Candidatus Kaiserbacteria bacterium]|nr:KH domain-containing protein [Candidatus Kaiserbacteria bacterium]
MERDQQFLEQVVTALVDHPESVKINRTVDEMGVLLTLDVHAEDMGKIIGRSGNTAKAIRTLLRVVGMKNDARVNLKINEPEGGTRSMGSSDAPMDDTNESVDDNPDMPKSLDDALDDLKI